MPDSDRSFRILAFTQVAVGAVILTLAEVKLPNGSWIYLPVAIGAVFLAWRLVESRRRTGLPRLLANLLALATVAYGWLDWRTLTGDGLLALAHVLLGFQIIKLFQTKADRDWLQLLALSLMHVGAAAAITIEATFAFGLLVYMVVAAATMLQWNVRRELAILARDGAAERRLVGGRLPFGSLLAGLTLLALVATAVFFPIFPRTGELIGGLDLVGGRASTGFSESARLGHFDRLSEDRTPVLNVAVRNGLISPADLRLRGFVYDAYDAGEWRHGNPRVERRARRVDPQPAPRSASRRVYPLERSPLVDDAMTEGGAARRPVVLEISMPVQPRGVFFTLSTSTAIALPNEGPRETSLLESGTGVVRGALPPGTTRVLYELEVVPESPSPRAYTVDLGDLAALPESEVWLALPEAVTASGKVRELAESITAGLTTPLDRALALEDWLLANCEYRTTELRSDPGVDPVEHFLFVSRAGHCQLFGSALALLLRTIGIPSRFVQGYAGGDYNEITDSIIVRRCNAHAWVEAYIDGIASRRDASGAAIGTGWVTLDATPPMIGGSERSIFGLLGQLFEAMRGEWDARIVGFEARHQEGFLQARGLDSGALAGSIRSLWSQVGGASGGHRAPTIVLAVALLLVAAFLVVTMMRPPRQGGVSLGQLDFFGRTLRVLGRHGFALGDGETPSELVRRAGEALDGASASALTRLVERYNRWRFGGEPLAAADRARARADLALVDQALKRARADRAHSRATASRAA